MKANLTIPLAVALAVHLADDMCEAAHIDFRARRTFGPEAQLAAQNLRDLFRGIPRREHSLLSTTIREYLFCYLRGCIDRKALRRRISVTIRNACALSIVTQPDPAASHA